MVTLGWGLVLWTPGVSRSFAHCVILDRVSSGVDLQGCKTLLMLCCFKLQNRLLLYTWWRHQMETFSTWLALCAGNLPVTSEFPPQRPVTRSFDVFFDLRLNKRLSRQSWGWWFATLSHPLWRHCNEVTNALGCSCCTFEKGGVFIASWDKQSKIVQATAWCWRCQLFPTTELFRKRQMIACVKRFVKPWNRNFFREWPKMQISAKDVYTTLRCLSNKVAAGLISGVNDVIISVLQLRSQIPLLVLTQSLDRLICSRNCPWVHVARSQLLLTWRHYQMETFSALLAICAGNSPITGEFPVQRPATQSFDFFFFDLHRNQWLSKQW